MDNLVELLLLENTQACSLSLLHLLRLLEPERQSLHATEDHYMVFKFLILLTILYII